MDMNFFPQAAGLNRGTTHRGKTWKAMEAYVIRHPGTRMFVRPTYLDSTWCPAELDYGILVGERLWNESFNNTD
jgi:hypothetical protein